jgi:transmembrane sensor
MESIERKSEARMQEAAEWWAHFQEREPAAEELTEWLAWMEQDQANARAFQSMNELALSIRHTRTSAPNLASRMRPVQRISRVTGKQGAIAAALVGAICLSLLLVWGATRIMRNDLVYATSTGEQRAVLLADGSRVMLGGASAISADFTSTRRNVRLVAGEAYFEVKHEAPGRPFVVDVGPATVAAIGTAFDIRKSDARIALTVTEGRVKVNQQEGLLSRLAEVTGMARAQIVEVNAAQQVVIEPHLEPLTVASADPRLATAWREGRLEFVDEPLDAVIQNVSRYATRRLVGDDERLHSMTYTGSFDPKHLESWLSGLEQVFPVEVSRTGEVTRIHARSTSR